MSAQVPDIYIEVPIETDPQDVLDDAYQYLIDNIPGWEPAQGNLDVWILMAVASLAAETRDVASMVPASIFRWFGANLAGVPPIDAATATCLTDWTLVDANGYTIPAGTQVAIPVVGGDPVPFMTTTNIVVAPGSSVVTGVEIEAVDPGTMGNGLGAVGSNVILLDALIFVSGITQEAATSGGVDDELDTDYLNRLSAELQLLAPRPILPIDFAIYSRNVAGVYRAAAVDGYNPVHNLLSANDASLETSIGSWVNSVNSTPSWDATFGVDGTHSLKLTSLAAGNYAGVSGAPGTPVVPGETYTALATVRPVLARTCNVQIAWYTAASGFISTSVGTGVAVGAGATQALSVTAAAPATAAYARVVVNVNSAAAANEVANFDKMSFRHGITTDWVAGGTVETNLPRTITVGAVDANGVPVNTATKTAIQSYLAAAREVNFVVNVIDPVTNLIDVTTTVNALPGWDLSLVQSSVADAIAAYLNPASWGILPGQGAQDWTNTTVLRYLQLAKIIGDAAGVEYVVSLTFGIHGGTMAASDLTLIGVIPLTNDGTVTITVNP